MSNIYNGMGKHKLWTQLHFIDGNLNAQRYRDEMLKPMVVPFVCRHHLMFQHDNTRPLSQGFVYNSWTLKMSQFFHGLHTHQTCHPLNMFGMLLIDMYESMFQFQTKSSIIAQPLKRSGTTFHRPQSTPWSTLWAGDVSGWMRQIVLTGILIQTPTFSLRYSCPTDEYLYLQSVKSID